MKRGGSLTFLTPQQRDWLSKLLASGAQFDNSCIKCSSPLLKSEQSLAGKIVSYF